MSPYHHNLIYSGERMVEKVLQTMNTCDANAINALRNADVIILTLGNATHIEENSTGRLICSPNGMPKDEYSIKYANIDELTESLSEIHGSLKRICRNDFSLIITISPIRYAWHTFSDFRSSEDDLLQASFKKVENQDPLLHSNLDKAKLRVAVDKFISSTPGKIEYFPSYDIAMDELRLHDTFSHRLNSHLHVGAGTPEYIINRFLNAHCTENVASALKLYRREISGVGRINRLLLSTRTDSAHEKIEDVINELEKLHSKYNCEFFIKRFIHLLGKHDDVVHVKRLQKIIGELNSPATQNYPLINSCINAVNKNVNIWTKNKSKVAIYGVGQHTDFLFKNTAILEANIEYLFDRRAFCRKVYNLEVIKIEDIKISQLKDLDAIIISSIMAQDEIYEEIEYVKQYGIKIIKLYNSPDLENFTKEMLSYNTQQTTNG